MKTNPQEKQSREPEKTKHEKRHDQTTPNNEIDRAFEMVKNGIYQCTLCETKDPAKFIYDPFNGELVCQNCGYVTAVFPSIDGRDVLKSPWGSEPSKGSRVKLLICIDCEKTLLWGGKGRPPLRCEACARIKRRLNGNKWWSKNRAKIRRFTENDIHLLAQRNIS